MRAPHNFFTLAETLQALRIMHTSALQADNSRVRVEWSGGRTRSVPVEELVRGVNSLDEVQKVTLEWTYADGSTVTGHLIDRPEPGQLRVEHGGQAELAAQNSLNFLRELRPQRARARKFLAGLGPLALVLLLLVTLLVAALSTGARVASPQNTADVVVLAVTVMLGFVLHLIITAAFRRVNRRVGGTRLAHPPQVHRRVWTAELGTVAAVLGVPIAVAGVLLTALTASWL